MDQQQVDAGLEGYIEEYKEWIEKEIPINDNWIEEINYLSFLRDEIHKILAEYEDSSSSQEVQALDKKWQEQVKQTLDKKFTYKNKPTREYPQHLWWWHLDKLDSLTEQQRSTL